MLAVSVAAYLMFRWFEHRQIYIPHRVLEAKCEALGRPVEDFYLNAADGVRLNAWYFPAQPGSARRHLAFLICHGNAGNISHRLSLYQALLDKGVNVLAFDYRGYGQSAGNPGEEGTYLDAQAAYGWLRAKGFAAVDILAYGESLGGAIVTELALREKLAGIILQSTFSCIPDIGKELFPFLPVRWICSIYYNTVTKLPRITIPVLILHSRGDSMIGFRHAEKNFAAANEPKLLWEIKGDHNDMLESGRKDFDEGLDRFFSIFEKTASSPASDSGQTPRPTLSDSKH
jgi:fermentation-respiration switch protein FrsA (DUF1100 family)